MNARAANSVFHAVNNLRLLPQPERSSGRFTQSSSRFLDHERSIHLILDNKTSRYYRLTRISGEAVCLDPLSRSAEFYEDQ